MMVAIIYSLWVLLSNMVSKILGPKKGGFTPIPSPKGNPPVCTTKPVISGNLSVGSLLSCTQGTWLQSPVTYLYQWQRDSVDIPGAINPTYTFVNADIGRNLICLITAWNKDGPAYALSNTLALGGGLVTLTFSATTFTVGSASSGTIIGATIGSTITSSGLPSGLTINGVARTWAWSGSGTPASSTFSLIETLTGATGSPKTTVINYTIVAAGAGPALKFNVPANDQYVPLLAL